MEASELIESAYKKSMEIVGSNSQIKSDLETSITLHLKEILERSESSKAVLTVIITSLVYKILHPEQDIKRHQTSIENGYSGRTFDTKFITPFLKKVKFPAMAESGWLTRSLEQKVPYDNNYSGAIRPDSLKKSFLETINIIQNGKDLDKILHYFIQGLIIKRNSQQIDLAKPLNLPIITIINLLSSHFESKYSSDGASRLPTLALYAAYQCLMNEMRRFEEKRLLEIESHTSADTRSGRIGDIDIVDEKDAYLKRWKLNMGFQLLLNLLEMHLKNSKQLR